VPTIEPPTRGPPTPDDGGGHSPPRNGGTRLPLEIEALVARPAPGPHRTTVPIDGRPTETLADLPPARARLLFVGLNPSPVSVEAGHYHQGRLGRRFWERLIRATVLPPDTAVESADDALVAAGHGITDLIKRPSRRDEASDEELTAGVGILWQKVALWRPAAIVFVYKRAAEIVAGRPLPEAWGQIEGVALAGRPCFLMPGPYAPTTEVDAGLNLIRNLVAALPDG
jgi:TDG/mug DNA glycosylase family protein